MGCLKDMENTNGSMEPSTKGILIKDIEMDMELGRPQIKDNFIKEIIFLIENMDMDNIIGQKDKFLKEHILKI